MKTEENKNNSRTRLVQRVHLLQNQTRNFLLVALGILLAFLVLFTYTSLTHESVLNANDVNQLVANAMASATPRDPIGVDVYQKILPSIVYIDAQVLKTGDTSDHIVGTGTLISDRGDILTARHVVIQAIQINITYFDGTEATASVVSEDEANDIAVLRANNLPSVVSPATLAGSGGLRVGDIAIAVGHPFGVLPWSLTQGVVSGLHRPFQSKESDQVISDTIQFDAAVNPGNSGGPLLDENGEVVGIVTGLLNPSNQNVFIGIGFAIPIETAAGAGGSPLY